MNFANARTPAALVTGASYGLGRAVAIDLAREGYSVIITARDREGLEATASRVRKQGRQCLSVAADLADESDVARLIDNVNDLPQLNVWVHCASAATEPERDINLADTPSETVSALASVTFLSTVLLLRGLKERMRAANGAHAILIASDWATGGVYAPPMFSAVKAASARLFQAAHKEYARDGISLTTLFPGDIATFDLEWNNPRWDIDDSVEEVQKELGTARIPLADIVETIRYVIQRRMAVVQAIYIAPLDPEYQP